MLSDYINLAQNIRNSYLVRTLSSKKEDLELINYQYANALTQKYSFNGKVDMIRFFTINFDEEKEFRNFLEILLLKTISDGNFKEGISVDELGEPYFYLKNLVLKEELKNKSNLEHLLVRFPKCLWYLDDDIINNEETIDILVELIVLGFDAIEETINEMLYREMNLLKSSRENIMLKCKKTKSLQKVLAQVSNLK